MTLRARLDGRDRSPIRLVCLDLGGVLIRVCRDWEQACQVAKLDLGKRLADPDVRRRLAEASHRHETDAVNAATFDTEVGTLVGLPPDRAGAASEAWLREPYARTAELINRLAALSGTIRSACLSNTNRRHWGMMTTTAGPHSLPLDRLTWRFVSFEIGHMKPSPAIFRHVEQVSGLPPGAILFFDDNEANIAAARACGWSAELIDPARDAPGQVMEMLKAYGIEV